MIEKEDKRILKTKKLIKNTFFEILKTKSFDKITIAEIVDKAMISKGTFYYHYEDKYDFIQKLEEEMIEDYKEILSKRTQNVQLLSNKELSEILFFITTKFFPEYSMIEKIQISGVNLREQIENLMADEIEKIINQKTDLKVKDKRMVAKVIAAMQITFANQLLERGEEVSLAESLEVMQDIITVCNRLFL